MWQNYNNKNHTQEVSKNRGALGLPTWLYDRYTKDLCVPTEAVGPAIGEQFVIQFPLSTH